MINTKLLNAIIDESGKKRYWIANKLGLSSYGLQKKINGETEFKASEIKGLSEILGLSLESTAKIFLLTEVNKTH